MNPTDRPDISELRINPEAKERKGSPKFYTLILPLLITIISFSIFFFFFFEKTVEVNVAEAIVHSSQEGVTILNASGYVTPRRRATIAAKITGRMVELHVDEGMFVEQDQVLARLDDTDAEAFKRTYKAELEVAQAAIVELDVNLADAQRNLKRYGDLFSTGVVSQQTLDDTQRLVDSLTAQRERAHKQVIAAQTRLAAAQQDLTNYIIKAPFTGIVVSKDAQIGEMVSPVSAGGGYTRTGIATIVDMESLEIEVDVNESYIAKVVQNQEVTAILDAYPEWSIPAHVRTIIPTADRQKATVKVRITFDKLDPKILPDMGVKVSFLDQKDENVTSQSYISIPRNAVSDDGAKQTVFILKNGILEKRAVKTAPLDGNTVAVLAGITSGESVVVGDTSKFKTGLKARRSK